MDYQTLATDVSIEAALAALKKRGVEGFVVADRKEALEMIKALIPSGASVMNGSSVTLDEIGFIELLKSGAHDWNNLHDAVLAEQDKEKQALLRKQSVLSDYYLGSVHAFSETGELVIASNSGSQLPHIVFTSKNVIFVVGAQKIVPNLDAAFKRLYEYVVPLEDKHMHDLYGSGTMPSKVVIFNHENPMMGRNVRLILVKEKLGF